MKKSIDLIALHRKIFNKGIILLKVSFRDRSVTPQAGMRKIPTTTHSGPANKSAEGSDQRLSAPAKSKF